MAIAESVSALAAGNECTSMVQKAFLRRASDDFLRLLSRGLAVGGVVAELVCGGSIGSGCSKKRVWRDGEKGLRGYPSSSAFGATSAPYIFLSFPPPTIFRQRAAPGPCSSWVDPSSSRRGDAGPGSRPRTRVHPAVARPPGCWAKACRGP